MAYKGRRLRNLLVWLGLAAAAAAVLLRPADTAQAAKSALELCAAVVIPSLFPFYVLSGMAVRLGIAQRLQGLLTPVMRPLFGVGGVGAAAYALGILGGYPTGARTAAELYKSGACSKSEAQSLLNFTGFCGPAFILGAAGAGVFGSTGAGALLMAVHIVSGTLCGIILKRKNPAADAPAGDTHKASMHPAQAFVEAVTSGFRGCIELCGFVVFFLVLIRLISSVGITKMLADMAAVFRLPKDWTERIMAGLLELSSGVWSLSECAANTPQASFAAASFFLGWGGFSVHFQVMSCLDGTDLSAGRYMAAKLLHGTLAAVLALPASLLLPPGSETALPVFYSLQSLLPAAGMALTGAAGCCAVLLEGKSTKDGESSPRSPLAKR